MFWVRYLKKWCYFQTPLHLAVLTGQEEVIDRLLCAGANTKLPDRNGNNPAHLAVLMGNTSCLARLLKYQRPFSTPKNPFPELNMKNFDGKFWKFVIFLTVQYGNVVFLHILLLFLNNLYFYACIHVHGKLEFSRINYTVLTVLFILGFTPAHIAAQKGNLQAIKLLVRCKADINMADGKSGKTPLHYAAEENDLSVSSYLILEVSLSKMFLVIYVWVLAKCS